MPKKTYSYPSHKNPIKLFRSPQLVQEQLKELQQRIIANEPPFKRKNDKIPALPFWIEALSSVHYHAWCFECFVFIREALRHGIISFLRFRRKTRNVYIWSFLKKRLYVGIVWKKDWRKWNHGSVGYELNIKRGVIGK